MFSGIKSPGQVKPATGQSRYGLKNKVHSVVVNGMGEVRYEGDYYGPPRAGQSFAQFQSLMSLPIAVGASGAVVGAMIAGPIGAVVGGVGSWLLSSGIEQKRKPLTQGG